MNSPRYLCPPYPLRPEKAFTLVELLVVITIIAILIGLLFPVIGAVMKKAKKTEAETNLRAVVAAIEGYHVEYGRYPQIVVPPADGELLDTQILTEEDQAKLMAVLMADVNGQYEALVQAENPRLTVFVNVKDARKGQKRNGLDASSGGKGGY